MTTEQASGILDGVHEVLENRLDACRAVCLQRTDWDRLITHEHISFPINLLDWSAVAAVPH